MNKQLTHLGLGGALLGIALLAACGGGGGSAPLPTGGGKSSPTGPALGQTRIKLAIPRAPRTKVRPHARHAKYVSTGVQGLQVVVTTNDSNATTQTIYADLTAPSVCATPSTARGNESICTVTVPTLGASETITATQVDATPIPFATPQAGYGSGFPAGSHILAVGSATATATGSTTTVALGMGAVISQLYDCGLYAGAPEPNPQNFVEIGGRIVVTQGLATTGRLAVEFSDAANGWFLAPPQTPAPGFTPLPQNFVDVNGSPTPVTLTSNNALVTLAVLPIEAGLQTPSPLNTPASSTSVSIPDDSTYWDDCEWIFNVNVAAMPSPSPGASPPAALVMSNNLTATLPAPFTTSAPNYAATLGYSVAVVGASPSNITVGTGTPAIVTGIDYGAPTGMAAESTYTAADTACTTAGLVTITPGSMDPSVWQQPFVVSKGTGTGTCTFYLYDNSTGVLSNQISVTVGP